MEMTFGNLQVLINGTLVANKWYVACYFSDYSVKTVHVGCQMNALIVRSNMNYAFTSICSQVIVNTEKPE